MRYRDTLALTRAHKDGGLVGATDQLKAEASQASAKRCSRRCVGSSAYPAIVGE